MENSGFTAPEKLPNSQASLILGIIGLICATILACCYGFVPGLVLGILAVVYGNGAVKLYKSEPPRYEEKGVKNARAGVIMGWIAIGLSALFLILIIILFAIYGADMFNPEFWEEYRRRQR